MQGCQWLQATQGQPPQDFAISANCQSLGLSIKSINSYQIFIKMAAESPSTALSVTSNAMDVQYSYKTHLRKRQTCKARPEKDALQLTY